MRISTGGATNRPGARDQSDRPIRLRRQGGRQPGAKPIPSLVGEGGVVPGGRPLPAEERHPEVVDVRRLFRGDTEKAQLIQRGQSGATIVFEVRRNRTPPNGLNLVDVGTATEAALHELVEVLPETSEDDTALDAILGQSIPVRLAVSALVDATSSSSREVV